MNEVDRYVLDVLRNIEAPPRQRSRIEADLRAHLEEALRRGESPATVFARMGSPEEVAQEFMAGVTLHYAGFWRRVIAFAVDLAVILLVASPLFGLAVLFSSLVPRAPSGWEYALGGVIIVAAWSTALMAVGVFILYFPMLEGRFGQTLGKRLLGLRVVKETGTPIGYREAFLRRLPFYFDFIVLDALFIPFTPRRQRAFDIIARTVVIREAA